MRCVYSTKKCLYAVLQLFLLATCLAAMTAAPAFAQKPTSEAAVFDKNFDHFSTGFPLAGAHEGLACDACHTRGVLRGLPTKCSECHKGVIAVGKTANHLPTAAECSVCHDPKSKTWVTRFEHQGIVDNCERCHNGGISNGKTADHIKSTNACAACHKSTNAWDQELTVDHKEVRGSCSSCHAKDKPARHFPVRGGLDCGACHNAKVPLTWNNASFDHGTIGGARCDSCHTGNFIGPDGKPADHPVIPAGTDCGRCHKGFVSWATGIFDHSTLVAPIVCATCHAKDKAPNHFPTTQDCSACHSFRTLTWSEATFDHATIGAARCDSCHNGTFGGPDGKTPTHPPTPAGSDCNLCHTGFDTFAGVVFDHTTLPAPVLCAKCHAKDKPAKHFPVPAAGDCSSCHSFNPLSWNNATFDHSSTTSTCVGCHSGGLLGAVGKGAGHITSSNECVACHVVTAWNIVTVDHAQIVGLPKCNRCHADDKGNHFPVLPTQECGVCHSSNAPLSWVPATAFTHDLVTSIRCDGCHTGTFTGPDGKTPDHVGTPAGSDCNLCHKTTTAWNVNVVFDHSRTTSACNTCHRPDLPPGNGHIPVPPGAECNLCHSIPPPAGWAAAGFNHNKVTALRCEQCHSGAIALVTGKTPTHPPTPAGLDCNGCHKSMVAWNVSVSFDHTGLTTGCNTCHLPDKPAGTHIPVPAGSECVLCHHITPPPGWTVAAFNHATVTAMRCDACHTGTFRGPDGKTPTHVATPTGMDCGRCHKSNVAWNLSVAFDHAGLTAGCDTCHLPDKPAGHLPVPSGTECIGCHRVSPPPGWTPSTFAHTIATSLACETCHNGSFVTYGAVGKNAGHVATPVGVDCGRCHGSTVAWNLNVTFDHTGLTTGCDTCHATDFPAIHIPVPAGNECGACHRTPPPPGWTPSIFTHAIIGTARCDSCHSGAFTAQGAIGLPGDHCPLSVPPEDCGQCHTPADWGNTIADCPAAAAPAPAPATPPATGGGGGGGGGGGMGGGM